MRSQIEKWLSKRGAFNEGLRLYQLSGGNYKLAELQRIAAKPYIDKADKDLLVSVLEKLKKTLPEDHTIAIPAATPSRSNEPDSISKLREEGRKLKKRESFIHAQLVSEAMGAKDQEDLFELAQQMMEEIHPELDRVYDAISDFEKNGTLPPDQTQKIISEAVEKMNKRINMKTRIYRLQKFLKGNIDDADRERYLEEIKQKKIEIAEIEQFLGL